MTVAQRKAFAARLRKYDPAKRHAANCKRFGLTAAQYKALLVKQGGRCAICRRPPKTKRLHIDHAHDETKRVRGLLCLTCNRYRVSKNDAGSAWKVFRYLASNFDARAL